MAAVSYLNTKPLLYGIERSNAMQDIEIVVDYPSKLAKMLREGDIDLALLPVAAMKEIANARVISDYGIATDGNVVSVALFSQVPIEEIQTVYLDYQSRTSVRLAQLLVENYWKKDVTYLPADENYISNINGATAGVIIGDRALQQLNAFQYAYDLSAAWKQYTGLDFVFAAWIANKDLSQTFIDKFNAANAEGLKYIDEVIRQTPCPYYSLDTYYRDNIKFYLDDAKKQGMQRFLEMI